MLRDFFLNGIKAATLAGGVALLSACSGELSAVPMASVSSSGEVMRGTLVPAMDFSGRFSLVSADGSRRCEGTTNSDGSGVMTCSDGSSYTLAIPRPPYGRFNGAYVDQFDNETVAVGWGDQADVDVLSDLLT